MDSFASAREAMVEQQIAARGIDEPALLAAFRAVPREEFVSPELGPRAYGDGPLPIGFGQTISQPYIVALTIAGAEIGPGSRVLEIGAGSGYAAAVIGQIAAEVFAIEWHRELAAAAAARIDRLKFGNVRIIAGDGSGGWPGEAPFDAIVGAASGSHVPPVLIDQLKPGGRLVMPVGSQLWSQSLVKLTKQMDGGISEQSLAEVRFVPLVGEHA